MSNRPGRPGAERPTETDQGERLPGTVCAFLDFLSKVRGYSPLTIKAYSSDLKQLTASLAQAGVTDPARADTTHLYDYARALAERHQPATVRRKLDSASSYYRHLVNTGALSRNPVALVPRPRRSRRIPHPPNPDQCRQLLRAGRTLREKTTIALLLTLGVRKAELIGANRSDLSPDLSALRIRGKGDRERVVPVPPATGRLLRQYLENEHPGTEPLVTSFAGTRLGRTALQRMFRRLVKRAGLQDTGLTIHSCRHGFATNLLVIGCDVATLAALLGHASPTTTLGYLHSDPSRQAHAVAGWGEALLGDAADSEGGEAA
jgi:site-specific recombinase XerD